MGIGVPATGPPGRQVRLGLCSREAADFSRMNCALDLASASDATLALALIAEQPGAARVAWARFSPMVRRILRRMLVIDDVDDLVQDVFLLLFQQLATLRDPQALKAFVIAISVRAGQQQLRRVRRSALTDAWLAGWSEGTSDVESEYALIRLRRVLEQIRERDRAALLLRFVAGMTVSEIAGSLETSVPTVQRRLKRARRRMELYAERDAFLNDYVARFRRTGAAVSSEAAEV